MIGNQPKLFVQDLELYSKILRMVGTKVDRETPYILEILFFWVTNTFFIEQMSDSWRVRRRVILEHMGVNRISRYIPLFAEEFKSSLSEWKNNPNEVEMSKECMKISFSIIARIMFGSEVTEILSQIEYEDIKTGELQKLSFFETWFSFIRDCISVKYNPLILLCPLFFKFGLGRTNKANRRNAVRIKEALVHFISVSQDEHSLYKSLIKDGNMDHQKAMGDLMCLLMAGLDTSAKIMTQILYRLKKHPDIFKKLKDEID